MDNCAASLPHNCPVSDRMRGDKTRPEGRDVAGVVPVLMPDAVIGANRAPSVVLYPHLSLACPTGSGLNWMVSTRLITTTIH